MKPALRFGPLIWALALSCSLATALPEGAPPPFALGAETVVPVDFYDMDLDLVFDALAKTGTGRAIIRFHAPEAGYPLMDMVAEPTALSLNGSPLAPSLLEEINSPDGRTKIRVLKQHVFAFSMNTLEIQYRFPSEEVTYANGGIRVGFFMGDVGSENQRGFLEKFAPSNLEFDSFPMTLRVHLKNSNSTHQLFTNGEIISQSETDYTVRFPPYFTPSSFYFHLTNQDFQVRQATYQGLTAPIPVTVYASSTDLASRGLSSATNVLSELEQTYGPFTHERAVAYITPNGGGMEYCGATITSLSALEHEFTHFWFARGVMPINGNAGWIDEAIASWRDNNYPSHSTLSSSGSLLAGFPDFQRMTPMAAYSSGARVMGHLDYLFRANGGLKPILKELFSEHKRQGISTPEFQAFVETQSGKDLSGLFAKHVYGTGRRLEAPSKVESPHHPRPFTAAEYKALR
ncbi:MAG: hypothetical protein KDD51_13465 [Bdellovibrionales bacterium]|nr:hypothetical protein [Bdellovibrionales bacterium]